MKKYPQHLRCGMRVKIKSSYQPNTTVDGMTCYLSMYSDKIGKVRYTDLAVTVVDFPDKSGIYFYPSSILEVVKDEDVS